MKYLIPVQIKQIRPAHIIIQVPTPLAFAVRDDFSRVDAEVGAALDVGPCTDTPAFVCRFEQIDFGRRGSASLDYAVRA